MKCIYCDKGIIKRLINKDGYMFNAEEPIIEEEPCEECGGTGIIPEGVTDVSDYTE